MAPKRPWQNGPDEPEQSHGHEQEKKILEYWQGVRPIHTKKSGAFLKQYTALTRFPLLALSRIVCDTILLIVGLKITGAMAATVFQNPRLPMACALCSEQLQN
jgi:hypothetical protein